MKKLIGYLLTPVFYLVFLFWLLIFHPIQIIAFHIFGKEAHKHTVEILNFCLLHTLNILGTRTTLYYHYTPPKDRTVIFVANHQNMSDITGMIWFFRKYNPKFVSKIELGKGIPSVSYNLRNSGAALIDRKNPKQAITELARFGTYINENKYSAVIFPEGTRAVDGQMKSFQTNGISILLKKCPNALIVPVAVENAWKVNKWGKYPMSSFEHLKWHVLDGIEPQGRSVEEVVKEAETAIRKVLKQ